MAVVASATGAAVFGLSGVAAGLAGGALLGAGVGGLYSAVTGDGNILNSMLTGGLIGGAAGGLGAAAAGAEAATAAGATGAGTVGPAATAVNTASPALTAAQTGALTSANVADLNALAASQGVLAEGSAALPGAGLAAAPNTITPGMLGTAGKVASTALTGKEMLGYGLAGTAALKLLGGQQGGLAPASATDPGNIRPYSYSSNQLPTTGEYPSLYPTAQYDANGMPILDTKERNYFDHKMEALTPYSAKTGTPNPNVTAAASGGIMSSYRSGGFNTNADYDDEPGSDDFGMSGGGKAKAKDSNFEDLSREEQKYFLNAMASPMTQQPIPGSNIGSENSFEKYMMSQVPQGAVGRVGATKLLDDNSSLNAGLSGMAMAMPGRQGVTTMPGAIDVGYTSARKSQESPYFNLNAYRSIDPMPGKGHAQGVNARYTVPFAGGGIARYNVGGVSYDQATQTYSGLPQMAAAPAGNMSPLPADLVAQLTPQYQAANPYKYSYDPAKQMYNKAIPSMAQLNAFKTEQDRMAAEQAAAANPVYESSGGAANGGLMPYNLGSYSDGGRLLKGPGDGVSDDIPATIANKQPARLADGEFVIPARIVSEIGNGSTDAGAKRLYAMMDRIQEGRKKTIGKKNVAKDTKAKDKLLA